MSRSTLSRVVWKVSLPVILAGASETFLHVIDTVFLARVGVVELGALAIADSVFLLSLVIPLSFAEALQILASRRAGQRKPAGVGAVFNLGFLAVVAICVASTLGLKVFWPIAANWFVEPGAVSTAVSNYLQVAAYGIFFVCGSFAYSALLMSSGKTRALIPATMILAVTSFSLGYALIFGKFGFPALGIRGAALGSLAAEAATFIFLTFYVMRAFDSSRYKLFRIRNLDWHTLRLLNRIATPIALQRALEVIRWFVLDSGARQHGSTRNRQYRLHLLHRFLDPHGRIFGDFLLARQPLCGQKSDGTHQSSIA